MTYCRINPVLWDDEKFIELDDLTARLWLLLISGNQLTALPGLQRGGTGSLAETLRRPFQIIQDSLQKLCDLDMICVDAKRRVICVPKAPKHNPAESPNHLRAWWYRWSEIPDCDLKFQHIALLKPYANLDRPGHRMVWDNTFGKAERATSSSSIWLAYPTPSVPSSTVESPSVPSSTVESPSVPSSTVESPSVPSSTGKQGFASPESALNQPRLSPAADASVTATVTGLGGKRAHDPCAPCTVHGVPAPCTGTSTVHRYQHRAPCTGYRETENQPPPQVKPLSEPEIRNVPDTFAEQSAPIAQTATSSVVTKSPEDQSQTPAWLAPKSRDLSQDTPHAFPSTDGTSSPTQTGTRLRDQAHDFDDVQDTGVRRIPSTRRDEATLVATAPPAARETPKVHCPTIEHAAGFHPEQALHRLREASRGSSRGELGRLCSAPQMDELGKISRTALPSPFTLEDFETLGKAWKAGASLRWMKHAPDMGMLLRNGAEHLLSAMLDAFEWRDEQNQPERTPVSKFAGPRQSSGPKQIAIIDLPEEQRKSVAAEYMNRFRQACGRSDKQTATG